MFTLRVIYYEVLLRGVVARRLLHRDALGKCSEGVQFVRVVGGRLCGGILVGYQEIFHRCLENVSKDMERRLCL